MKKMNLTKIVENWRETRKNKLIAISLIAIGMFAAAVTGDATFLMLWGTISVVLFFAKENWIV